MGRERERQTSQCEVLACLSKRARRVRPIFRRATDAQTLREIAQRINHLGWRAKQWVARRSGRTRGGGRSTARQVTALLRNPVYLGRFADGKGTRPGSHRAIVTDEVFRDAQAALGRRRTGRTALLCSPGTSVRLPRARARRASASPRSTRL